MMERVKHSEGAEDAKEVLKRHTAVTALQSTYRVDGDVRTVCDLGLGEPAQLAPYGNVIGHGA
jgi:hypothetical protein